MKIYPVGYKLFRVDARTGGQRDMAKLLVTFHSFANVSKTMTHFNFLCVSCLL